MGLLQVAQPLNVDVGGSRLSGDVVGHSDGAIEHALNHGSVVSLGESFAELSGAGQLHIVGSGILGDQAQRNDLASIATKPNERINFFIIFISLF